MLTSGKGRQRTLLQWLPTSVPLAKQDALLTSKEGKTFMNRLSRTSFHGQAFMDRKAECAFSVQPLTTVPPLGCRVWPLMKEESSDARKT